MGSIVRMNYCEKFLEAFRDVPLVGLKGEVPEGSEPSLVFDELMESVIQIIVLETPNGTRSFGVGEYCVVYEPESGIDSTTIDNWAALFGLSHQEVAGRLVRADLIDPDEVIELISSSHVIKVSIAPGCSGHDWPTEKVIAELNRVPRSGWTFEPVERGWC